jgi:hypothetical protein
MIRTPLPFSKGIDTAPGASSSFDSQFVRVPILTTSSLRRCDSHWLSVLACLIPIMAKKEKPNYYAVHKGRKTGVFNNWTECEQQIKGFSGGSHKGFQTYEEAEWFAQHGGGSGNEFYAVARGRAPGIYESWNDAQQQITGFSCAIHKKFYSRQEAENFVREHMDVPEQKM